LSRDRACGATGRRASVVRIVDAHALAIAELESLGADEIAFTRRARRRSADRGTRRARLLVAAVRRVGRHAGVAAFLVASFALNQEARVHPAAEVRDIGARAGRTPRARASVARIRSGDTLVLARPLARFTSATRATVGKDDATVSRRTGTRSGELGLIASRADAARRIRDLRALTHALNA